MTETPGTEAGPVEVAELAAALRKVGYPPTHRVPPDGPQGHREWDYDAYAAAILKELRRE